MLFLIHSYYLKSNLREKRYGIYNDETCTLKYSSLKVVRDILKTQPIQGLRINVFKQISIVGEVEHKDIIYSKKFGVLFINKPIKLINMPKDMLVVFRDIEITRDANNGFYIKKLDYKDIKIYNSNGLLLNNVESFSFLTFLQTCNLFLEKNSKIFTIVVLPSEYLTQDYINVELLFKNFTDQYKVVLSTNTNDIIKGSIFDFGETNLRSFKGFSYFFDRYNPSIVDFSSCVGDIDCQSRSSYFFNPILYDFCIYVFNSNQKSGIKKFLIQNKMIFLGTLPKSASYTDIKCLLSRYFLIKKFVPHSLFYIIKE